MKAKLQTDKGVNKDLLSSELELGAWSDVSNFRFRNDFVEKVQGITEIAPTCPIEVDFMSFVTAGNISQTAYLVITGDSKAYLCDGTNYSDRSKSIAAQTISSMTRISATVTEVVTSSAHGLATNNSVAVAGCTPSAHDAADASVTVINTTTFRYTPDTSTSAGAITPGTYEVLRGTGTIGTMPECTSGGVLNGYVLASSSTISTGGLYYQDGGSNNFRKFAMGVTYGGTIRVFRNWIFQLAPLRNTSSNEGVYPQLVRWSASAVTGLPTTFTPSTTVDAGFRELSDTPGHLVDCLHLGETLFVYKSDERYAFRHIGGTEVFDIERMFDPSGLYARNCIANTPAGQVYLGKDLDLRIHGGGPQSRSLSEGRVKTYLQNNTAGTGGIRVVANPFTKEVWVFHSTTGTTCDKVLMWNWENDTFSIRTAPGVVCAGTFRVPAGTGLTAAQRVIVATSSPKLGYCDAGTTDLGSTITATLERTGIHLGDERRKKTLHRSSLSVDATAGNTATVTHGSHAFPDTAPSYQTGVTHTVGTTRDVNSFVNSAEYVAWKLSTTATDYKLRTVEIECNEDGEF